MSRVRAMGPLAALLTLVAAPGLAAEAPWSVEATLASEYISKGIGRSDGEPHIGVQAQRRLPGDTYAGVWSGSLRSPLGADAETHLYVGWRPRAAGWGFDVRPMYKILSGARPHAQTEQWELRADAARTIAGNRLRLRVEHAFDGYGTSESSTWMEANLSRKLADSGWSAAASLGRREQEVGRDYTAWSLGVQRRLTDQLAADLRWIDSDREDAGREYRGRLYFGLTATLR